MSTIGKSILRVAVVASLVVPGLALAQTRSDDQDEHPTTDYSKPKPSNELPPSQSSHDVVPPPASPLPPEGKIVTQAGVGGPTAYSRAGVLELGGSAAFSASSGFSQLSLRPSIGWFLADNFELSAIGSLNYSHVQGADATSWGLLAEPSYHLPLSSTLWAFLGLGLGASHVDNAGTGFAMAPRLGANILVGRSGLLSPSLLLQYSTTNAISTPQGTLVAVTTSFGVDIGYTVMW